MQKGLNVSGEKKTAKNELDVPVLRIMVYLFGGVLILMWATFTMLSNSPEIKEALKAAPEIIQTHVALARVSGVATIVIGLILSVVNRYDI